MPKLIFRSLAIFGFFFALLPVCLADSKPPVWQGVYEGTIGTAHVVVALAEDEARYFYAGKANDLGLIVSAQGTALGIEETLTPTIADDDLKDHPQLLSGLWKVNFADDAIKGTWTDPQGKHPLPIALRRVSTADQSLYRRHPRHWEIPAPMAVAGSRPRPLSSPKRRKKQPGR